jgi:hypothetical protein
MSQQQSSVSHGGASGCGGVRNGSRIAVAFVVEWFESRAAAGVFIAPDDFAVLDHFGNESDLTGHGRFQESGSVFTGVV